MFIGMVYNDNNDKRSALFSAYAQNDQMMSKFL